MTRPGLAAIVSAIPAAILIVGALSVSAQQTQPAFRFEAASIKINKDGEGGFIGRQPGGRVNAQNAPLNLLITFAYQIQGFQLVGLPEWSRSERYDIVAKLEDNPEFVLPGSGAPDPMRLGIQGLLEERFKLKVHRETRDIDMYALVLARPDGKLGPAMKQSAVDCSPQGQEARGGKPPTEPDGTPVVCGAGAGRGMMRLGGFPIATFINGLAGQVGRTVVDRTGLKGNWTFEIAFAPQPGVGPPPPPGAEPQVADPTAPSLFTVLQEQLGLKLEATKGPVDVLVIDSIERPTPD